MGFPKLIRALFRINHSTCKLSYIFSDFCFVFWSYCCDSSIIFEHTYFRLMKACYQPSSETVDISKSKHVLLLIRGFDVYRASCCFFDRHLLSTLVASSTLIKSGIIPNSRCSYLNCSSTLII
jgi:hypothetical protein